MNARRLSIALVCAAVVVGCKTPDPLRPGTGESTLKVKKGEQGQLNLTSREIRLLDRDGKPLNGVAVQIGGRSFLVRDGLVTIDEQVLAEARKTGKLVVIGAGFLPLTLSLRDDAPTEIVMTATEGLGTPGLVGAGGGTIAAAGDKALVTIPSDFLTGGTATAITVGTYRPILAADAQAAFDREVAALVAVRAKLANAPAGTTGGCATPLSCGPVTGALGVSLTVDGPVKGGQVSVSVDLAKLTSPEDKASGQRILDTFAAFDASGDPTWRQAMKDAYGITLDGTMLTFPVKLGDVSAVDGVAAVEVDGLAVLGTRLEVTVITAAPGARVGALAEAVPVLPGDVPASLIAARLPGYEPAPALRTAGGALQPDNGPDAIFTAITNGGSRLLDTTGGTGGALTAAQLLTNNTGALLDSKTGALLVVDGEARTGSSLIANNTAGLTTAGSNGTLISNNTAGLIANNAGSLLSNNAGGFVANNAAGIVAQNGAGIVAQNGAGILANNGSQLTGFPYFPFKPEGAKYQLLQLGVPENVRETVTGLTEYLWPGQARVRAIAADGSPLTGWVTTGGDGGFSLRVPQTVPIVFFLQCELLQPGPDKLPRRAYAMAFAPGKQQRSMVAVDASTTMVATSTLHLIDYIPPEYRRLTGLAASYEEAAEDLADQLPKGTDLNNQPGGGGRNNLYALRQTGTGAVVPSAQPSTAPSTLPSASPTPDPKIEEARKALADLEAALAAVEARTGELGGAWLAFNPFRYGKDLGAADQVITEAQAQAISKSLTLRAAYDPMFATSSAGRFAPASFQAINPDSPPLPPPPVE